jgi:hypothetical protein
LLARVLPVPAGDTLFKGGQEGAMSLRDYVNALYTNDPTEQQSLTARCFQTAVHREWTSPDGTGTSVYLIQFGTVADARSYILSTEQADTADPANTDVFPVPRVADGRGLGAPKLDSYGNTLTRVLGDAGNVAIIIHIFVPARIDNSLATRLLQQQSGMLTSGSS